MFRKTLLLLLFIIFFLTGCSNNTQISPDTSSTVPPLPSETPEFVSDSRWNEANTVIKSNESATCQGNWIYYFTDTEIIKIDCPSAYSNIGGPEYVDLEDNKSTVCNISGIKSIAIAGDWIYYATTDELCKIRTDGNYPEVLISETIDSNFLIANDIIYYTKSHPVSATNVSYSLYSYDTETSQNTSLVNDSSYIWIIGWYNNNLYYYSLDDDIRYCLNTETLETHTISQGQGAGFIYKNQLISSPSSPYSSFLPSTLYVIDLDDESLEFTSELNFGRNISICGACRYINTTYWVMLEDFSSIYLIPVLDAKKSLPERLPTVSVVSEDKNQISIIDAWVYDNFIYYLGEKGGSTYLYRIHVDGSAWSQIN